jgi:hypothetical protein
MTGPLFAPFRALIAAPPKREASDRAAPSGWRRLQ